MPHSGKPRCAVSTCPRTRINRDCGRKSCKEHCVQAGGCTANGHTASASSARSSLPAPSSPPHPVNSPLPTIDETPSPFRQQTPPRLVNSPLPTIDETPSPFRQQTPPSPLRQSPCPATPPLLPQAVNVPRPHVEPPSLPSAARKQASRNATPGPSHARHARHASHMKELDVGAFDKANALAAKQRAMEAERATMQMQVNNQVKVTVWKSAETKPKTHIVQTGFTFPFFACTQQILSQLGLFDQKAPAGTPVYFQIYDPVHDEWDQAEMGHSIMLQKGDHPFFAASELDCDSGDLQDFELKRSRYHSSSDVVHIRKNLAGERESVRAQARQQALHTAQVLRTQHVDVTSQPPPLARPKPKPVPKLKSSAKRPSLPATAHAPRDIMSESTSSRSSSELEPFPFPWLTDTTQKRTSGQNASPPGLHLGTPPMQPTQITTIPASPIYVSSTSPEPRPQPSRSQARRVHHKTESTDDLPARRWPQDFYVCDIDACFAECKKKAESETMYDNEDGSERFTSGAESKSENGSAGERERSVKKIFAQFFGNDTIFIKSTFYDVRKRYQKLTARHRAEIRAALSAGRTEDGLWRNFLLTIPKETKHRELENAYRTINKYKGYRS